MRIQNALDNAAHFLIHPADVHRTPCRQRAAWPVTIVVFILTFGIVHSLSLLWLKLRKVEPQAAQQKIQEVFERNRPSGTSSNPTPSVPSPMSNSETTFAPVQNLRSSPDERKALYNYMVDHHRNSSEKISIRALGKDWFAWYNEIEYAIVMETASSYSTDLTKKIELRISPEGEFSIRNNILTVLPEDYAFLIQRLEEEVSTLRFIHDESSQTPLERPTVFPTRPQTILPSSRPPNLPVSQNFPNRTSFVNGPQSTQPQATNNIANASSVEVNEDEDSDDEYSEDEFIENELTVSKSSLEFTEDELTETQDQNFPSVNSLDEPCKLSCPQDWTLFKTILAYNDSYECNLGARGIFNVSHQREQHGDLIIISSKNTSHPLTIKILLNSQSEFSNFTINDQPVQSKLIPKEHFPILNDCFKRVLEMSAEYKFTGRSHQVRIPVRSLAKIPELNLVRFYEQLHYVHEFKVSVGTEITFLTDDCENQEGIDAGGLTRQFIEEIMKNIHQSKKLNFFKCHNDLLLPFTKGSAENVGSFQLPSLTGQEESLYYMLGYTMGWIYNMSSVKTGYYFDESLFKALLVFKPEELEQSFNALTEETCLRVAEALIEPRKNSIGENDLLYRLLNCTRLIKNPATSRNQLSEALEFAGVPHLPDFSSRFVNNEELNMSEIASHKEEFLHALYKAILDYPDIRYGQIGNQISAIHALGKGINTVFNLLDTPWSYVKVHNDEFANKIQGNINRKKIIDRIRYRGGRTPSFAKAIWLRDWILDPTTSNKDIRLFLKFVTGTTSLTNDGRFIEFRQTNNDSPLPIAHTCSYALDIPVRLKTWTTSTGETYTDTTKEGFIKILKDLVFQESNMSFHRG